MVTQKFVALDSASQRATHTFAYVQMAPPKMDRAKICRHLLTVVAFCQVSSHN